MIRSVFGRPLNVLDNQHRQWRAPAFESDEGRGWASPPLQAPVRRVRHHLSRRQSTHPDGLRPAGLRAGRLAFVDGFRAVQLTDTAPWVRPAVALLAPVATRSWASRCQQRDGMSANRLDAASAMCCSTAAMSKRY